MESWENKIIADRIDSLQDLPAGYSPNLSSKWEIIEAGLPQQKKRITPLLVRWSIAAAVVTAIILIGVAINQNDNTPQVMLASVKMPSLHISIATEEEQTAAITKPVAVKNKEAQKEMKRAISPIEIVTKEDKQLSGDGLKMNQVIVVTDSATFNTNDLAIVIPQPEAPKRAKRRTFQKDFDDGLLVMDTGYSKKASPQFSFKFQLSKPNVDGAQPSPRLQVKQVL